MPPNLESPIQTQMAVSILNRTLSSEYPGKITGEGVPLGWKHVYAQTDTGVSGIELDYGDNAYTVKRKLQLALNFPEQSFIKFGEHVMKNDLSARSFLQRSSSTPCLSPSSKDLLQRDLNGPIRILGGRSHCSQAKLLVKDVVRAIRSSVEPIPAHGGLGGAYYFRNHKGESIAIIKPNDEEAFAPNNPKGFTGKALGQPGLKRSVRVGETGYREVAAYLLDHGHFANVPPTLLVKITHSVFHVNEGVGYKVCDSKPQVCKVASIQRYIPHDYDASDYGTSSFPVSDVHRIGILDIRIFNTDRHAGNLLVQRLNSGAGMFGAQTQLIPIDHGLCLPESLEDPYFEWTHWPQASIPFSEDELAYIANLDPEKDCEMLRVELPMIREACLRVLVLSTIFLKEATAFGLCLGEIGEMMSREFTGMDEQPSELEVVCIEARRLVTETDMPFPETALGYEDVTQFEIDGDDDSATSRTQSLHHCGGFKGSYGNSLSKLEESEEEEEDVYGEQKTCPRCVTKWLPEATKLSTSLKSQRHPKGKDVTKSGNVIGSLWSQSGDWRSAAELLPTSANFVKLADMGDEVWRAFLEKFQELLPSAFHGRKCADGGQRQWQRLGASCQF